mmetsp:Transcript_118349/g.342132  ORF Transcript_118349/g.342132 Transcript_118349/m.342132 type:complete len:496 (-) Transcript_118349:32-1519(-)
MLPVQQLHRLQVLLRDSVVLLRDRSPQGRLALQDLLADALDQLVLWRGAPLEDIGALQQLPGEVLAVERNLAPQDLDTDATPRRELVEASADLIVQPRQRLDVGVLRLARGLLGRGAPELRLLLGHTCRQLLSQLGLRLFVLLHTVAAVQQLPGEVERILGLPLLEQRPVQPQIPRELVQIAVGPVVEPGHLLDLLQGDLEGADPGRRPLQRLGGLDYALLHALAQLGLSVLAGVDGVSASQNLDREILGVQRWIHLEDAHGHAERIRHHLERACRDGVQGRYRVDVILRRQAQRLLRGSALKLGHARLQLLAEPAPQVRARNLRGVSRIEPFQQLPSEVLRILRLSCTQKVLAQAASLGKLAEVPVKVHIKLRELGDILVHGFSSGLPRVGPPQLRLGPVEGHPKPVTEVRLRGLALIHGIGAVEELPREVLRGLRREPLQQAAVDGENRRDLLLVALAIRVQLRDRLDVLRRRQPRRLLCLRAFELAAGNAEL